MDLSLWELSDGEDHHMFFESTYHVGDVGNFSDGTVYSPDVMEEDSLNEKSCVQVLKIMIDKADEEITKLEEDIVMLQCQIAWDDEDWSKLCSVALREKIGCLDIAIEGLKKEITEDVRYLAVGIEQPEKLAQRLHDLLKPLLENYLLVKSKQRESSTIHMPAVLPADGLSEKKLESRTSEYKEKVEQKRCINQLKGNERENVLVKLKERKLNHSGQGKRMPKSAPVKSRRRISIKAEPPDPMPEALVATTSIENAGSRKMDERNNTDKEVITKLEVKLEHENNETTSNLELRETERKIADIVKRADEILDMEIEKQKIGASIKIRKARTYNRDIDKNILFPPKPLVKIERETSKITEITEAVEDQGVEMNDSLRLFLFDHRTKHSSRAKMNLESKTQVQQTNGIGTLKINHAKPISSLKTEGRRPQKQCKAEEIHIKSSSGEKITENETQAFSEIKIDGGPKVDVSLISSQQNKSKSYFGSQIIEEKKMKPSEMEHDPLVGMAEEAGVGTKFLLRFNDVDRLTLNDLRIMAKNQKLPRYYRLRKKELLEHLGLEGPMYLQLPPMQKANEKKGVPVSPANTI